MLDALIVIVNGNGKCFFGFVLPDHIVVEESLYLSRFEKIDAVYSGIAYRVIIILLNRLVDDIGTDRNALIADIDSLRSRDQLGNLILCPVAERASARLHLRLICHQ